MNAGGLVVFLPGPVDELFFGPAGHCGSRTRDVGSTPTLPSHKKLPQVLVCTPFGHRRMAALGADGQAEPWCLAAQAFLHGVGRTTVVEEGLIYARPVNARYRSCVPEQCRNATIVAILACFTAPADRKLAELSVSCTLEVLLWLPWCKIEVVAELIDNTSKFGVKRKKMEPRGREARNT